MNKPLRSLIVAALFSAGAATAQYNQKGMVHLAIGGSIGAHSTELESRYTLFGVTVTDTETDGAATTSIPIQIGAALTNRFTLGVLLEPGRYVPDSTSDQNNSFINVAIEPRFYLLNGERVAWTVAAQLGGVGLHIVDDTPGNKVDARYSGGAFGLGTGLMFGLGNHLGLGFELRYLATNLELRSMEVNDVSVTDFYAAKLRTAGVVAQLSLAFRFGG